MTCLPLAQLVLQDGRLWPVALALALLLLILSFVLYPPQVRTLRGPWPWVLPSLRAVALVALALALLQPVLIRARTAQEHGAVVVLLDNSASMSATDRLSASSPPRTRVISQLVSLADALGRLPEESRSPIVGSIYEEIRGLELLAEDVMRAAREAEFARVSGRGAAEAQERLDRRIATFLAAADTAAQEAQEAGLRAAGTLSQLARAPGPDQQARWIDGLARQVERAGEEARRSQEQFHVDLYRSDPEVRRVCDQLAQLSRLELAALMLLDEQGMLSGLDPAVPVAGFAVGHGAARLSMESGDGREALAVEPVGDRTDLIGSLRLAMQQLHRQPVQAIVLISDGRQVGTEPGIQPHLLPQGIPIFTVAAASPDVRDLSIESVDVPRAVFAGETLRLRVQMRSSGIDPRQLQGEASLMVGASTVARAPLRTQGTVIQPLELTAQLDEPGIHRLRISLPVQEDEADASNNTVDRWVKVLDQRLRVGIFSSAPTWDYRHVSSTLSRTPWVELRQAILSPGRGLDLSAQQILEHDLLILMDLPRSALSLEQWEAVADLVRLRGGSLLIVPGIAHLPQEYGGHLLAGLLPYPATARPSWRIWPGENPFYRAEPAPGADHLPLLRLQDDPAASRQQWDQLSGFYRFLAMPELRPGTRVLLREQDSDAPLLTERREGEGRVFFMATNETWRWRIGNNPHLQERFWLQLARHAAEEPYALRGTSLAVDVDRPQVRPGESARVRIRRLSGADADLGLPAVLLMRDGRLHHMLRLEPAGAGRFVAVAPGLPAGHYEVRLPEPQPDGTSRDLILPLRVADDFEAEMADLTADNEFLQRLAEVSGGKHLGIDELATLPAMLDESRQRLPGTIQLPLWSSGYLFVFVLGCFALEWALRKRFGMV